MSARPERADAKSNDSQHKRSASKRETRGKGKTNTIQAKVFQDETGKVNFIAFDQDLKSAHEVVAAKKRELKQALKHYKTLRNSMHWLKTPQTSEDEN